MSHARAAEPSVTVAEFDAFLEARPTDETVWELIDGQIVGMTNPNARHGQIAFNMAAALKPVARNQGCRVSVGGLRVRAKSELNGINATIPDITVLCGTLSDATTWIDDPTAVVEVLSPSTMDFDRGAKLEFYKSLGTVADIVIIYQDQMRVEHYRRTDDSWSIIVLTLVADELVLSGVSFSMPLSALYEETMLAQDYASAPLR